MSMCPTVFEVIHCFDWQRSCFGRRKGCCDWHKAPAIRTKDAPINIQAVPIRIKAASISIEADSVSIQKLLRLSRWVEHHVGDRSSFYGAASLGVTIFRPHMYIHIIYVKLYIY